MTKEPPKKTNNTSQDVDSNFVVNHNDQDLSLRDATGSQRVESKDSSNSNSEIRLYFSHHTSKDIISGKFVHHGLYKNYINIDQMNLSDDPAGPKVRLLRSPLSYEILIQFDAHPSLAISKEILSAGFNYIDKREHADRTLLWSKLLDISGESRSMLFIRRWFKWLGTAIRQEKGLDSYKSPNAPGS